MQGTQIASTPILGCGMCMDMPLTDWLPFVVYWVGILLVWSLIAGPICYVFAKRSGPLGARHPLWLFAGFVSALVVGAPLLMGAVFTPLLVVLAYWIANIIRSIRQHNVTWRRVNLILLAVLLCAVPISYARPRAFDDYRARVQAMKDRNSSHKPNPATQTSGTRQDENPVQKQEIPAPAD